MKEPEEIIALGPMLAEKVDLPFDSKDYIFEIKWDGMRALILLDEKGTRIYNRRGREVTLRFPELHKLHESLTGENLLLDGEIFLQSEGRPSFQKLQKRFNLSPQSALEKARENPVLFACFDLLYAGGDLTSTPLIVRKEKLRRIFFKKGRFFISKHVERKGREFFQLCRGKGLEGIMAKEKKSLYRAGERHHAWLKITTRKTATFILLGFVRKKGTRFPRAFLLGKPDGRDIKYVGRVGVGLTEKDRAKALEIPVDGNVTPFPGVLPGPDEELFWFFPDRSVQIEYLEETKEGRLRHPVFRGFVRDCKK